MKRQRLSIYHVTFVAALTLLLLAGCGKTEPLLTAPFSTPETPVQEVASYTGYAGWLTYTADGDLYTQHTHVEDLQRIAGADYYEGMAAWSPDGRRLAYVTLENGNEDIVVVPASAPDDPARRILLSTGPEPDRSPAWSPDGDRLAFTSREGQNWGIYVVDLPGTDNVAGIELLPRRLTFNALFEGHPAWSPDGMQIAYTSDRGMQWQIYVMDATGIGQRPLDALIDWGNSAYPAWSPDGSRLAFASNRDGNWEIYVVNLNDRGVVRLTTHPARDWGPIWTPDGEWLIFTSERSGSSDLYAIKVDGSTLAQLTEGESTETFPAWRYNP